MPDSTGLYIYCILSKKNEVQTAANMQQPILGVGIRKQPLYTITYMDMTAVVSNFSLKQLKANIDDVITHQKAIESIRKGTQTTILPIRFGTILRNQQEITRLITKSYSEYKTKLANLDGKDEFGIKVLITHATREKLRDVAEESEQIKRIKAKISSLPETSSGSDYLLKLSLKDAIKNEVFKKIEQLSLEIHKQLADISVDSTLLKADTEEIILNAAYLINQKDFRTFELVSNKLKEKYNNTGLIFHISGPWAPYSFC